MAAVEVPSYFICPISLEMMRDPVTLSTGITYDRSSIERWIFEAKQNTCPVTKQPITADELEITPNHTLRRLIQSWCTLNSSRGVERIPTPKPPVDQKQISQLIEEAKLPHSRIASLRKLKQLAYESERNKRCVEATPGAIHFLASLVAKGSDQFEQESETSDAACDEALAILHSLQISDEGLINLVSKNSDIVESLTAVLQRSNYQSRSYAVVLLKSLLGIVSPARLIKLHVALFEEVVGVIRDEVSLPATKAALRVLVAACPWGRNRGKAVEAGAVHVLVELLLHESTERRVCELVLVALDLLCGCAEGRAELIRHRAAMAVLSKKILRVSALASEKAVRILYAVARYSATAALLQEMVEVGVVSKLCMLVQIGGGGKVEEKAMEILRLHSRVWIKSPCLSPASKIAFLSS